MIIALTGKEGLLELGIKVIITKILAATKTEERFILISILQLYRHKNQRIL